MSTPDHYAPSDPDFGRTDSEYWLQKYREEKDRNESLRAQLADATVKLPPGLTMDDVAKLIPPGESRRLAFLHAAITELENVIKDLRARLPLVALKSWWATAKEEPAQTHEKTFLSSAAITALLQQ